MTLYDEINLLMEKLTEAWGSVAIACESGTCSLGDGNDNTFTAPTLVAALRLAWECEELGMVSRSEVI